MQKGDSNKKIVSGFAWKLGERLCSQGVSFLISLILARLLSPDDYGIISLVLVFIGLAEVFVTSGFSTALIQKKDADETDFSTMFYCSLLCSIGIYLLVFIAAPIISGFYKINILSKVLRVFAIRIPLSVYFSIQNAFISRHMMFKYSFFSSVISALVSGALGVFMAFSGYGVWALTVQYLSNTVVNTIVLSVVIPWRPKLLFSFHAAKRLMNYGWKVLAADFSGTFFNQLRSLIIGRVYTAADLAFYTKGQQLPELISTNLSSSVMTVLFPAISNYNGDGEKIKDMTKRAIQTMSYIIFPMMVGLAVVAPSLVIVLFSDKWIDSVFFMQILCIAYAVDLMSATSLQTIKAIGRSDVLLKLEFIKKPIYFLLLIFGISINIHFVAITMVMYAFYGAIVNMLQLGKYISYGFFEQIKDICPSICLTGIMAVLVHMISLTQLNVYCMLLIQICVGIVSYILMSELCKCEIYLYLKSFIIHRIKKTED